MGIFDIFNPQGYTDYGQGAVGPVPTPNPPSNVSYTPQLSGSTVQQYNGPAFGSQYTPTYEPVKNDTIPNPVVNNDTIPNPVVNNPKPTNNNSGIPAVDMSFYQGWNDQNAINMDWAKTWQQKLGQGNGGSGGGSNINNIINSGYNDYFNKLNDLMGGLNTQADAQNQIAQNSYNQSISDLNANKQSSLGDLATSERKLQENQVKNLRDITSNLQNQYMAGNVMLGARGAGDSSAANQYSYALNREGSKLRGNVMNQTASSQADIEGQKAKLNNIVTQETSRLNTEFSNAKQSISSWLAEQQNAIRSAIADGTLKRSQDIANATQNALNMAMSEYNTMKSNIESKKSALEQWAMNNADSISKLQANMAAIGQFAPTMASAGSLNGAPTVDAQGNIRNLFGYGNSTQKDIYGNPIIG